MYCEDRQRVEPARSGDSPVRADSGMNHSGTRKYSAFASVRRGMRERRGVAGPTVARGQIECPRKGRRLEQPVGSEERKYRPVRETWRERLAVAFHPGEQGRRAILLRDLGKSQTLGARAPGEEPCYGSRDFWIFEVELEPTGISTGIPTSTVC